MCLESSKCSRFMLYNLLIVSALVSSYLRSETATFSSALFIFTTRSSISFMFSSAFFSIVCTLSTFLSVSSILNYVYCLYLSKSFDSLVLTTSYYWSFSLMSPNCLYRSLRWFIKPPRSNVIKFVVIVENNKINNGTKLRVRNCMGFGTSWTPLRGARKRPRLVP